MIKNILKRQVFLLLFFFLVKKTFSLLPMQYGMYFLRHVRMNPQFSLCVHIGMRWMISWRVNTFTNVCMSITLISLSTANMSFYQLYLMVLRLRLGCKMKLQPWTKYFRQTLVFMWNSALLEKFNFYFLAVFWYYWQNFHFGSKARR